MDIFGFLSLLGGLALFLYGMQVMGEGLTGLLGSRLRECMARFAGSERKALLFGAAVTAALQSSSAVTVMTVGFVSSGILNLEQAMGITMGANIGTTLTAWILAGNRLGGAAGWLRLLRPISLAPLFAMAGVLIRAISKKEPIKKGASALVGFAVLIFGMNVMEEAAAPLAQSGRFLKMLAGLENPVRGVLGGCVMTAAIQSSSASVGILQVLCENGRMDYGTVIPIILGQNIGTCVTAILASAGMDYGAKRAAFLNLYFNLIGAVGFLAVFFLWSAVDPFGLLEQPADSAGIAAFHSGFNILSAVMLLPFSKGIIRLTEMTVKPKKILAYRNN